MSTEGKVYTGTSGWHYDHWTGPFYPEGMGKDKALSFYAERFPTVEINNSFYRLPEKATLEQWRSQVPEGFIFSVKASRYITHMKKLKQPRRPLEKFLNRIGALGGKLGPVLFQLPPNWKANPGRLESFLGLLPGGLRTAFEFRDPSWLDDEIYRLLEENGAALCIYDIDGRTSPRKLTAGYVYVRLHGPGERYRDPYGPEKLKGWAGALSAWKRAGRDVYCYFDNDNEGHAVDDAAALAEMLDD